MLDYLSTFVNTNGVGFPNTGAVDSSGGAATDGTEFIAAMIQDSMWGVWQAVLDYVGLSPNGITEAVGASQVLEALRKFDIPGKTIHAVWNDDPATLGIRAIQMTGQGILIANYTELDDFVYVGDADNAAVEAAGGGFYHASDAAGTTPNVSGPYLILPDARGRVYRTLDLTGSVDPDGAGRLLGDGQDDAMQRITGSTTGSRLATGAGNIFGAFAGGGVSTSLSSVEVGAGVTLHFDNANSTSPNAAKSDDIESRMINLAFDGYITY